MEPISGCMHVPIEGRSKIIVAEEIEDSVAIGEKTVQSHVEKRVYLERIRNSMQKPIEGRSRIGCRVNRSTIAALIKGAIFCTSIIVVSHEKALNQSLE